MSPLSLCVVALLCLTLGSLSFLLLASPVASLSFLIYLVPSGICDGKKIPIVPTSTLTYRFFLSGSHTRLLIGFGWLVLFDGHSFHLIYRAC